MNGYDEFDREIIERLTRIEAKVDTFAEWRAQHDEWSQRKIVEFDRQFEASGKRLDEHDKHWNWVRGGAGVMGLVWALFLAWIKGGGHR